MLLKISWKFNTDWENIRRIKLLYNVNDEPYGLIIKSMFLATIYSVNEPNLIISAQDMNECAYICVMNNECQFFEYKSIGILKYRNFKIKMSKRML